MKNIVTILSAFILAGLTGQAQTTSSSAYTGTKKSGFHYTTLTSDTMLTDYDTLCYRSDNEVVTISKDHVPLSVQDAFNNDFRRAKKIQWRLDLNAYAVDFKNKNKEYVSAYYNAKGQLLEFITLKKKKTLTKPVLNQINSQFSPSEIKEIMEVKRSNKKEVFYVITIFQEGKISAHHLDSEGKVIE